jgi:xylan 1,4-beta-xylosidase
LTRDLDQLPHETVRIDAGDKRQVVELWRHSLGIGGINTTPLPDSVVTATRALRPRLVRIFVQQFFDIYPEHGRFDWSRLDPYMDALAATGAQVVAAICVKPGPLFEGIDHAAWRPCDPDEWRAVIEALVRRYSVERNLVTHWEIGNETDIGEQGGSPYLVPDAADYAEFYELTAGAVRAAAPHVKVGGTAACWVTNQPLPGFVEHCRTNATPLDFISWHLYSDDWGRHADGVREGRRLIAGFPGQAPELMVTEWNKAFDRVSVADQAHDPRRAALVAAAALAMDDAGLDWSFYYHLWDQVCDPGEFEPFFSRPGVEAMVRHWNEVPHRFGLFGERGEVRPQYFVYQLMGMLDGTRVGHQTSSQDLHVYASAGDGSLSAMVVNTTVDPAAGEDRLVTLTYTGLAPGRPRLLTVYRIDSDRRWCDQTLQQAPLEQRVVVNAGDFEHQLLVPSDTVAFCRLTEREGIR